MPLLAWISPIKRLIPRESAVDLIIRHVQIRFFQENTYCLTLLPFPTLIPVQNRLKSTEKNLLIVLMINTDISTLETGQTNILENESFFFASVKKANIEGIAKMKLSNN